MGRDAAIKDDWTTTRSPRSERSARVAQADHPPLRGGRAPERCCNPGLRCASDANGRLAFVAAVAGASRRASTIDPDGSRQTEVTDRPGDAGEHGLSWAPDGSSLLVVLSANHDLVYALRPDGKDLRRIEPALHRALPRRRRPGVHAVRHADRIRAAPPARHGRQRRRRGDLHDGRRRHARAAAHAADAPTSTEDHSATWSPDGRRIAFQRVNTTAAPGRPQRDLRHARRADPTCAASRLASLDASNPRWSRDGTRILFNYVAEPVDGKDANIYTVRLDGTGLTKLTHYSGGSAQAFVDDWSPDGTKIVFHFHDAGVDELYVMDADGSNPHPLTHLGPDASPRHAAWGTSHASP